MSHVLNSCDSFCCIRDIICMTNCLGGRFATTGQPSRSRWDERHNRCTDIYN